MQGDEERFGDRTTANMSTSWFALFKTPFHEHCFEAWTWQLRQGGCVGDPR